MSAEKESGPSVAAWWRRWSDGQSLSRARLLRELSIPLILFGLVIFFSLSTEGFLSVSNLLKIVNEAAVVGILALGMTFVLILAGVDLSVGSIVSLTTVILSVLLVDLGLPIALALILVLLVGCLVGTVNGLIIANTGVPPVLVTLGMLYIVQSVAFYVTEGATISLAQFNVLTYLGQGYLSIIPIPVIVLLILSVACYLLLSYTSFGKKVVAIGNNRRASALMGLDVTSYIVVVYLMMGLLASIAGLIVAGRLASASSEAGLDLELSAIAAAVLGGASLSGGSGSIIGTLAGALILSVLFNGLILMGVPFFYQLILTGVVLILALAVNEALQRRT